MLQIRGSLRFVKNSKSSLFVAVSRRQCGAHVVISSDFVASFLGRTAREKSLGNLSKVFDRNAASVQRLVRERNVPFCFE